MIVWIFKLPPDLRATHDYVCLAYAWIWACVRLCSCAFICVCFLSMSVCSWVCLDGWDCSSNPPDSPWWFLRSLPVYLNRCHRATCPISAAPVLQSKTLPRSLLSISQTRLSGKTLSKLCSITEQACLIFHKPENLAKCLIYKSEINLRLLSWGHVWVLCIFQPYKPGVINVSLDYQTAKRTSILKFLPFFVICSKDSQCSPIKCNLWFNHAYGVKNLKCIFHLLSFRSGTSPRHRACLQSICWVQGQRPPGSSTETRTPPIPSGDWR